MIRPATKIALEVVAGIVAVAVLLVGAAAWRLSEGPLPVSFLTPLVAQAANDRLPDNRVEIADMVIVWVDGQGALELQAVDVRILGEGDREVVTIPRLAVDFSVRAALAGRLVPKKLVFAGASLTLVRAQDGTISFGLTGNNGEGEQALPAPEPEVSEQGSALLATLLEAVSAPDETASEADRGRRLEGLSIRDAAITVFDQRSGGLWLASGVSLEFRNTPLGMAGVINAHVLSPGGEWDLIGTVRATTPDEPVVIVANVNNITLPDFARTMVALEPLAMLDSAVSGRVIAKLNRKGLAIEDLEVDLNAGEGTLALPANEPEPFYPPKPLGYDGKPQPEDPRPPYTPRPWAYDIDSAHIKGRLTWPEGEIELDDFAVKGEAIDLSISGTGKISVQTDGSVQDVALDVKTKPVAINIPNVTVGIAGVDGLTADLRYAPAAGRLDINKASVLLGEGYFDISGSIEGLGDESLSLALDGELEKLLLNDIMQIWPPRVGSGAREWVVANVSGGIFSRGSLHINAPDGALDQQPLPDEAIDAELEFADVTVSYLGELPPIEDGRGHMKLTGNSFAAFLTGGRIEPANGGLVQISKGSFKTRDFQIRGNDAFIDVQAAGSMTAILALLDEEPLGYAKGFGLDPRDVSGTGRARITTTLPMRSLLPFDDVTFGAKGHVSQLDLPDLPDGITMNGGEMDFDVNNFRLRANGLLYMADVPMDMTWVEDFNPGGKPSSTFNIKGIVNNEERARLGLALTRNIDGALPVEAVLKGSGPDISTAQFEADLTPVAVMEPLIGWRKEIGIPATLAGTYDQASDGAVTLSGMSVSGEGVQVRGSALFRPDGALQEASVTRLLLANGTDLSGVANRSAEDDVMHVDVNGPVFDARDFLDGLFDSSDADEGEDEALRQVIVANANVDRAIGHEGTELKDVTAHLRMVGSRMQQLSLDGEFVTGGMLDIEMKPTTYGTRKIEATSQDAGAVLRSLDLYGNIDGGSVEFTAEIDDRIEGSPLEGELTGTNLRVREAPILASILTLGSLTGISDTLQGEGILFTKLEAPVRVNDRAIDLKDAIMSGPAIGATIKGHIDRGTDEIDLGGTIVPAYTVNSFLGNIPVIGDIFVGREGEGLFGITYGISGKASDPEVTVNPLAALLPGILRRIFEIGGSASEDVSGKDSAREPQNDNTPSNPTQQNSQAPTADTPGRSGLPGEDG